MFNTAGMQQFVPYFMGKEHSLGKKLYNIQWCVRTVDIDEVGDGSHLTFFEMMGNRSLGDYFKEEAIRWSQEFLTSKDYLWLDMKNIAVSVFAGDDDAPRDEESAKIWKSVGVSAERIAYLSKSENRWGPAGTIGPCWPDSEIFYRIGEWEAPTAFDAEKDKDNRLEIRNNVFMSYYKSEDGSYSLLDQKNVDTGMGFERLCLVMQCLDGSIATPIKDASVYEIDMFKSISNVLEEFVTVPKKQRIMADHLRTAFLLIEEGLTPSNEWRGYVLRRLIRRAYFQGYTSDKGHMEDKKFLRIFLGKIKDALNTKYDDMFHQATVDALIAEMQQFAKTIHHGEKLFHEICKKIESKVLPGDEVFKLYDTYGFPVELTQELAGEHDLEVDMKGFEKAMQTAQQKSRAWAKQMFIKEVDRASYIEWLAPTLFVGYDSLESKEAKILKDFELEWQRVLIFDQTAFYAEWWGQKWDSWTIELDDGAVVNVIDVQKYGGVYLHFVR